MDLILETDLGHDPDDFFALCYLVEVGVNIRSIVIVPGDPDQVAFARFLCKEMGLDIPIGASKLDRTKRSSGGVHHFLLEKYRQPLEDHPDGLGWEIVRDVHQRYPESELFVIGPVTNVGTYLQRTGASFKRATMQGGFVAYDLHKYPCRRISKFEGAVWQPTFNLNGDRLHGMEFMNANIGERRFVSKNVCHTVVYNKAVFDRMVFSNSPACRLFREGMEYYLTYHDEKKFHDPTAAVCHLHPEVATWIRGRMTKMGGGWGAVLDPEGDYLIADIDYDKLWECITNFK